VIEAQQRRMEEIFARDPAAIAVIESALIFEVVRDARARGEKASVLGRRGDRRRIDRIIVVTAPDALKIARYTARIAASEADRSVVEADARIRLAHQVPDAEKVAQADYVLDNSGDIAGLRAQVEVLWPRLKAESNNSSRNLSLK
jgi:dephospho-CoA kinase